SIQKTILSMIIFNITICVASIFVFLFLGFIISDKLLGVHNSIMDYMRDINRGVFIHEMDPKICKRNDEYGVISRYMVEVNDSIRKLVSYDALTGLLNRRAAMTQLDELVKVANTSGGETFCLVIGDIDFFKKVNDTYGHSCGDNVLKMVSKNLNTLKPEDGFTARWGGEEFLIALKGKLEDTLPKLQNLYNAVKADYVEFEGKEIKVTMTFGISEYIAPGKLDVLITNADFLLYKGKESGRNKIVT
ncbi:MAG: GGDEF domain-containing protein, partial [Wujia sp.]